MTIAEIRARILHALNDDPDNPVFWSKDEIDGYVQDAMELLAEESEGITRTFTIPRRPGHMVYFLDGIGDNIMVPYRIWLPDLKRRLGSWSITDLDGRHEQWMTVTGDPWVWWPIDWQQFGVWPVPAAGGGWLHVSCYVWPEALLEDTARPEFRPTDHEALVLFGESEGALKQHLVAQAVDAERRFAERWGQAGTRESIKQLQGALHARERQQGDTPG